MMIVHSECIANAHAGSAAFEVRAAEAATATYTGQANEGRQTGAIGGGGKGGGVEGLNISFLGPLRLYE